MSLHTTAALAVVNHAHVAAAAHAVAHAAAAAAVDGSAARGAATAACIAASSTHKKGQIDDEHCINVMADTGLSLYSMHDTKGLVNAVKQFGFSAAKHVSSRNSKCQHLLLHAKAD